MKKADLLHTTILIVAILSGYSALQYAIFLLSSFAYAGDLYRFQSLTTQRFVYELLMVVLFSAACVILVRNGRKYAAALLKEEEDEAEAFVDDAVEWQLDRRNIIFVFFIGMGLYTLIQYVPSAVADFFEIFSDKVGAGWLKNPGGKPTLLLDLLRITIGAFLIYASPSLTNFIEKSIAVRLDSTSQSR